MFLLRMKKNDEPDDDDATFWNDNSIWKRISKAIPVDRISTSQLKTVIPDAEAATKVLFFFIQICVINMLKTC